MKDSITCSLCFAPAFFFTAYKNRDYYSCSKCNSILLNPKNFLSSEEEKKRYLAHNNNVEDKGYQDFVKPIVNEVKKNFNNSHLGLDFGSGTGSVVSALLKNSGYDISIYDPYFYNKPKYLENTYDYIVCCEVIEHFKNPNKEFALLRSLLKEQGKLICKTSIYEQTIDFNQWYYKNDTTHVFMYHKKAFEYIADYYKFKSFYVKNNVIVFNLY